jgi:hypothetical protein
MPDFIFLMHNDAPDEHEEGWDAYLGKLGAAGHLRGGSAIGGGVCARKDGAVRPLTAQLNGFIRVEAGGMGKQSACWRATRSMKRAGRWRSGNCQGRTRGVSVSRYSSVRQTEL